MPKPPGKLNNLNQRIGVYANAHGTTAQRVHRTVANTIVGQLMPPGVVKGGTAMKLRVGESASRFTPDFDAARAAKVELADYVKQLSAALEAGWNDFTGTLTELEARAPEDVPDDYAMQRFEIHLEYKKKPFAKIKFELGRDEVGSTETAEKRLARDIIDLFAELGLPEPEAVPVMAAEHQVAQKLHACTSVSKRTGQNERAHDLVDLQILDEEATLVYASAAEGLSVIPDITEAIIWANSLIASIVAAGGS
ncbi:nucleotidyl transferase AbiEii/AbiGii toxin family protein [Conexibacter sp. DBS9H8]|uniref:nucleotidyl transferase AbiEii/AbiGii toxin family protein n=1 Tax=Conexibacter sp. DBS9H8 TaxID=2937801 RepID=UPI002010B67E|nr:nucleotidyl transferase AbiEii/AbiGii toxin family protein [Conexibacter sp. DBS9H8]